MSYRFRVDEGKLVLQVYEPPKTGGPYYYEREGTWRDASVGDIPVNDPFTRVVQQECGPSYGHKSPGVEMWDAA